jgi:uncharacterized protein YndB with AHSA1/START domain
MVMNAEPVRVEKIFHVPVARLWRAFTDESEIRNWYFDIPGFIPKEGFEFSFTGGPEDRKYLHLCRIVEVKKEQKLSYTWRYSGYQGSSQVTFEMEDDRGNSLLRLTHEGLETFPQDNPDFSRANFEAGWSDIINGSLNEYLRKQPVISMG